MNKSITVDIADIKTSDDPDSVIVTYALGSCIAVILHDPVAPARQIAPHLAFLAMISGFFEVP